MRNRNWKTALFLFCALTLLVIAAEPCVISISQGKMILDKRLKTTYLQPAIVENGALLVNDGRNKYSYIYTEDTSLVVPPASLEGVFEIKAERFTEECSGIFNANFTIPDMSQKGFYNGSFRLDEKGIALTSVKKELFWNFPADFNVKDWHTYRLVVNAEDGSVIVFVDDTKVLEAKSTLTPKGKVRLWFGDGTKFKVSGAYYLRRAIIQPMAK